MKNYSSITVGSCIVVANTVYHVTSVRKDGKFYAEDKHNVDDTFTGYINRPYRKW